MEANVIKQAEESLRHYRSKTMKDYLLMVEYKHLKHHAPNGVYLLPSFDNVRKFYGVIFVRKGLYRSGVFKFRLDLPEDYNSVDVFPVVTFTSEVYHPYVHPETQELSLRTQFPTWNPGNNFIVHALLFVKKIFYMKDFSEDPEGNPAANTLYSTDRAAFVEKVEECVKGSGETLYKNDPESSLKFSSYIPRHDNILGQVLAEGQDQGDEMDGAE